MPNEETPEKRYVKNVYRNTQSDLIEITDDKLKNILIEFISNIKKVRGWMPPLTLFVSILLAILTANFNKNFLSITKDTWSSIFYMALIISGIWLIISLKNSLIFRKETKIDSIIKKIKNN